MELEEIKVLENKSEILDNISEKVTKTTQDKLVSELIKIRTNKHKLKELGSIIEQDVITDEDAEKFKRIWCELAEKSNFWSMLHSHYNLWTWADWAFEKSRFDIVMLLFQYVKWTKQVHKVVYLIRYCPNDDYYNKLIESELVQLNCQELKEYTWMNLSLLDLCYGKTKFPKPYIVEILFNKGMDLTDIHTEQGLMIDDPECLKAVFFSKGKVRPGIKYVINKKDEFGYTALHRAAQKRCKKSVQFLLEAGANFGTTNNLDESCISQINPEQLEEFFNNNCIKSNNKSMNDEELTFTFDYR